MRAALGQLNGDQKDAEILLAYEPVWAIGENGIPATSDYADDRQAEIIAVAKDVLGHTVPCLYGGSVNPENCEDLIACPNIDGLFLLYSTCHSQRLFFCGGLRPKANSLTISLYPDVSNNITLNFSNPSC